MTKKVLGNDPFATTPTNDSAAEPRDSTPSAKPARSKSTRPSKRPSTRPSKTPASTKPKAKSDRSSSIHPPPAAKVPVDALDVPTETLDAAPTSEPDPATSPDLLAPAPEPALVIPLTQEEPVEAPVTAADEPAIDEQIRALEAQLDGLLAVASYDAESSLAQPAVTLEDVSGVQVLVRDASGERLGDDPESSTPSEQTGSYFSRQWGREAMRERAEEVDEFGMDPTFVKRAQLLLDALYTRWWRVETQGIENVPSDGRVILCANHAGAVPYDGVMLATALRREHPAQRELRWLADDFVFHFPFMGVALNRLGAVRACQENAERLLRKPRVVGVFPEGLKGISKPYNDRYQLQRFGRGGHIKLALRTQTPIVPVAILGSEETHPLLPTGPLAKLLNLPLVPVTPTFPWLGLLGAIPLPSKWKIAFLEPISVTAYPPSAADDEVLVGRLNEKVRTVIQEALDRLTRERVSVFKG
ncbi:MAG: 1-acyl-sn-glycerol-3-phosphate acyltransferase [Deltaproteobacteria bacterium]|nr:1-acyl-sn-glycerol-3-phosphate acyltransferase [Deltaproteobacteria bacterium]